MVGAPRNWPQASENHSKRTSAGLIEAPFEHWDSTEKRVREAGLRPTRQRVALAGLLFAKGDRHLSAEELHEEAVVAGVTVSLATVYNTLHQFTDAGLLRILAVEGENRVMDIGTGPVSVTNLPEPPEGMEIANVDIIVRLRPKSN